MKIRTGGRADDRLILNSVWGHIQKVPRVKTEVKEKTYEVNYMYNKTREHYTHLKKTMGY